MGTAPPTLPDPSRLLLDQADSLPAEGAERERGLTLLARCLAELPALSPDLVPLILRLTRRDLLELYSGFALGTFVTAVTRFRPRRAPPAAQIRLQERLLSLLRLPPVMRLSSGAGRPAPPARPAPPLPAPRVDSAGLGAWCPFSASGRRLADR